MICKDRYFGISDGHISKIRQAFERYTQSFFNTDLQHNKHIDIKRFHTYKVCENIVDIAHSLQMDHEQLNFVELLALMHDIGRFEQYMKYQTFSDAESENHSVIGIKVMKQQNFLTFLTKEQTFVIFRAILNHNIKFVPTNEDPLIDFYSRLLRDADKLDIWRITIEMDIMFKIQELTLPKTYIVPPIFMSEFNNHRPLSIEHAHNIHDTTLFRLSWLFDLNFTRSFELMREREIADKLIKKVPGSDKLEHIKTLVNSYLTQKCFEFSYN
jgi:hypothetical protein